MGTKTKIILTAIIVSICAFLLLRNPGGRDIDGQRVDGIKAGIDSAGNAMGDAEKYLSESKSELDSAGAGIDGAKLSAGNLGEIATTGAELIDELGNIIKDGERGFGKVASIVGRVDARNQSGEPDGGET